MSHIAKYSNAILQRTRTLNLNGTQLYRYISKTNIKKKRYGSAAIFSLKTCGNATQACVNDRALVVR